MTTRVPSPPPERRSQWIPWLFVGMFGIIIAVNGLMAFFAFDSWTGLSAHDPYKRGLDHNRLQAEATRQAREGWRIGLDETLLGTRQVRLSLVLGDRQKQPVSGADVQALIVRPVAHGADFLRRLRPVALGRYETVVSFPHSGLWEVRYRIRTGSRVLKAVRRLKVP